jgi:hypothetical protein
MIYLDDFSLVATLLSTTVLAKVQGLNWSAEIYRVEISIPIPLTDVTDTLATRFAVV